MSVASNIAATYRGPGRVVRRLLDLGQREDRLLAYVMGACVLMFVARMPQLAREAHLNGEDLNMNMGGTLLAWVFIAPLMLYGVAGLARLVAKVVGGQGSFYSARLALFWALLAASPLVLLNGLVAGFIGSGPGLQLVGLLWCGCFLWFWIRGIMVTERTMS